MNIKREIQESISTEHVIAVLNEALAIDGSAIKALCELRVPCNKELADHPTIQVMANKEGTEFKVGFIGILNGLFGISSDGWGAIAAEFEVVCPKDYNHSTDKNSKSGDKCKICGEILTLGKIIKFRQIKKQGD